MDFLGDSDHIQLHANMEKHKSSPRGFTRDYYTFHVPALSPSMEEVKNFENSERHLPKSNHSLKSLGSSDCLGHANLEIRRNHSSPDQDNSVVFTPKLVYSATDGCIREKTKTNVDFTKLAGKGRRALLVEKAKNKIVMLRVLRDLRNKTPKGTDETNQRNSRPSQDMSIQSEPKDDEASVEGTVEPDIRPQRQVPKFIILHYSPFKAVWDWIILLLVLYTAVFTPYMAAFLLNEDETRMKLNMDAATRLRNSESVKADPLVLVDLVVDVMFIVDILINFRTTYVKDGEVITDPLMIAKNYLKGWFLIDTLAAVPFDLLLFGSGTSDTMTITGSMKTARLLRLLRVARRMNQYSQYGSAVLILMMVIFALIAHWLACVFYAIAYVERPHLEFPISWLDSLAAKMEMPYIVNDTTSGPDIRSKYVTAMYFTLTTLTSIGFGNVAPNTNAEKIFSIIAMMIGSLMSAVVFGNVSSIMLRVYQGTEEFHERSESIKEFILFHSIPKTLADRLQDSFQHSWSYTNGIDMNQVLKSFPDCLQADICLHLNRNLLSNSVAFRGASPGCLRALSLKFRTTHAPPGDTLIHPGDILTAIYFIARGTIEVVGKTDEVLAILGKDDIFGQNADDLASVSKSNYSVRALTYCDLNKIELDDLEEILDTYPEFAKSFKKKFTITFNLRKGDFQQRTTPNKMDEETLKFIRQKQPKLQFKKSSSYDSESPFEKEYEPKHQQKSSVTRQAQQPRVPDNLKRRGTVDMSSDEEDAEIVELSPEKATSTYEPDVLLRRKNSMNSIAGALSSVISAVSGQRKKGPQAMQTRSFYPKSTHLQRGASVFSDAVIQPQQPSPLELNELPSPRAAEVQYLQPPLTTSASASSSSSHIPKSCSNTTGPLSGHSPVEYDVVHGHPEKCSIRSFSDIDIRLEAINERMNNFENNLCTTVDAILEILGHKPQIIREQFLQRTTRPKVLFSDSLLTAAPSSSVGTGTPSSASEVTVAQRSPSDCIMTIPHLVKSPSETSGILKRY